jgi:hypothetical protein
MVTELPEQTELVAGIDTVGTGFTITKPVSAILGQPFKV